MQQFFLSFGQMKFPASGFLFLLAAFLLFTGCERDQRLVPPSISPTPTIASAATFGKTVDDLDAIPTPESTHSVAMIKTTSLPEEKNAIGADTPISITFDREMNNASVEQAFLISPPVVGKITWENTTMTFKPEEYYEAGKTYSVTLTSDALDTAGNNFPEKFKRNFAITEELKILAITPKSGEIVPETDISIIFNKPIFELGTIDELDGHDFGITVDPPFPFRYRLAGTSTLQIQGEMPADAFSSGPSLFEGEKTEHRLPRSAEITVTIPETLTALDGSKLGKTETFTIKTPRIALTTREIGQINPFAPLELSFSIPVSLDDAKTKISIARENGETLGVITDYGFTHDDKLDTSTLKIMPTKGFWEYETAYRLQVDAGIAATEGNLKTEQGLNSGFRTQAFVAFESPTYGNPVTKGFAVSASGEFGFSDISQTVPVVGPDSKLTLFFDHPPVSLDEIKSHLTIPEAPEFTLSYKLICKDPELRISEYNEECEKTEDTRRVIVTFTAPLQNEKMYSIRIAQGMKATIAADENRKELQIDKDWLGRAWELPKTQLLAFNVVPKPKILSHYAAEKTYREFCFFSNTPIDAAGAKQALSFVPALPNSEMLSIDSGQVYEQPEYSQNGQYYGCQIPKEFGKYFLHVSTGLGFETEYKLTLGIEAKDVYGQKLSEPYSFIHRTGPLKDEDIRIEGLSPNFFAAPLQSAPIVSFATENLPSAMTIDICQTTTSVLLQNENSLYRNYDEGKWIPNKNTCVSFKQDEKTSGKGPWQKDVIAVNLKDYFSEQPAPGIYVVAAHHPRVNDILYEQGFSGVSKPKPVTRYAFAIAELTDLALVTKNDSEKLFAWVSQMSDGKNTEGAEIIGGSLEYGVLSRQPKLKETVLGKTDVKGVLEISLPENNRFDILIARTAGKDEVIARDYFDASVYTNNGELKAYIFTDRPIYRPGDAITGKATFVQDIDANFALPREKTVTLSAWDNNGTRFLENEKLSLNEMGSTGFTITIPADVALGNVSFEFCTETKERQCFYQSVAVEEYKKPEFEVKVTTAEKDIFQGETTEITVSGNYYFGMPLSGGEGKYFLKREDYYFDRYTEELGYQFDEGNPFLPFDALSSFSYDTTEYLKEETIALDDKGEKRMSETVALPYKKTKASINPKDKAVTLEPVRQNKTYTAEATAEDSNQVPVYASARFTALAASQFVGIKSDKQDIRTGEALPIKFVIVDSDGKPIPAGKASLIVIYQKPVTDKEDADARGYFPDFREHLEEEIVHRAEIIANAAGKATYEYKIDTDKPGTYRLVAETKDDLGRLQRADYTAYVYSDKVSAEETLKNENIELIPDKTSYAVGDIAKISVISPLDNAKTHYLITQERERFHSASFQDFTENPVIEVKITENMIPNIRIAITGQQFGDKPRLATGAAEIIVDTASKELEVKVKADKDQYLPGETVTLEIESKKGGQTEFAVVVADKANLALFEDTRQKILDFFYAPRGNYVSTLMTLLDLRIRDESEEATAAPMPDVARQAGGGNFLTKSIQSESAARDMDTAAIAPPMVPGMAGGDGSTATKKRSNFQDTAFFTAIVPSDKNGKAEIFFPLPDNITNWQVLVIGFNKSYAVGENVSEIIAKKPLLLRPQLPRFVRVGDKLVIRADITNESGKKLTATAVLNTENVKLSDDRPQKVELEDGEIKTVSFEISAENSLPETKAAFTFSVSDGDYRDDVVMTLPILAYSTPETVASSGVTSKTSHFEKIRLPESVVRTLGRLKITTSVTLANYLHSGLNSLVDSPYASNEMTAGQLMGLVVFQKATSLPNFAGHLKMPQLKDTHGNVITWEQAVKQAISTLGKYQRYDGSWGYYPGATEGNPYLTAEILKVFAELRANKIAFPEKITQNATNYLINYLNSNGDLRETGGKLENSYQADNRASMLSALSAFPETRANLRELTNNLIAHRELLTISGKLAFLKHLQNLTGFEAEIKTLFEELAAKLEIDPRGMFLSGSGGGFWPYFDRGSSHEYTAHYLAALIRAENGSLYEHPFIPKVMKWLIASRENGQWQNSRATVAALNAFVDFLSKSQEHLADFNASILADGREVDAFEVNGETLFDTHEVIISVADVVERGTEGLLLQFLKQGNSKGALYYDLVLNYYLPVKEIAAREEGISVRRELFPLDADAKTSPVSGGKIGDVLKGKISVTVPSTRHFMIVDSPLPAGTELINFRLKTSDQTLKQPENFYPMPYADPIMYEREMMMKPNGILEGITGYGEGGTEVAPAAQMPMIAPDEAVSIAPAKMLDFPSSGSAAMPNFGGGKRIIDRMPIWDSFPWNYTEMRDDRLVLYSDRLEPGVYEYEFFVRVTHEGEFAHPPARAEETHFPEIFGRTAGGIFTGKQN